MLGLKYVHGVKCIARFLTKRNKSSKKLCASIGFNPDLKEKQLSRYAGSTIMSPTSEFRFSDYDCVGFDLDNTVCRYNLTNMVKLEYRVLAKFLVDNKGYSSELLYDPFENSADFLQKGLVVDFDRGNILRLGPDGYIQRASHGTSPMTDEEITTSYGDARSWDVAKQFSKDMLVAWNGPLSQRLRTLLDYFDMPSSLIFGRIVDTIDKKDGKQELYRIWPDVLDGLVYMYSREHFALNEGGYFPEIKRCPELYIRKTSPKVIEWLKNLKRSKTTFLMTGSNADFANFTATYALGDDWHELFDHIIFYARKPGFFTGDRPFMNVENLTETTPIAPGDLEQRKYYSQGNWKDLMKILVGSSNKTNPRVLYVGDNLIQDVYTPATQVQCDTVAISEEMLAEGMVDYKNHHEDGKLLVSATWGSYFVDDSRDTRQPSFWSEVISKHSKICIPNLDHVAERPLDTVYTPFTNNEISSEGFYPGRPASITTVN